MYFSPDGLDTGQDQVDDYAQAMIYQSCSWTFKALPDMQVNDEITLTILLSTKTSCAIFPVFHSRGWFWAFLEFFWLVDFLGFFFI